MPSTRQFFINLRVDIFGSGLKKSKKPVYQSRTYHYSSNSTRNFDHGKQRQSVQSTPSQAPSRSRSSTQSSTRTQVTHYAEDSEDDEKSLYSVPGSWPEEEDTRSASPAPSYRQTQRSAAPLYRQASTSPAPSYRQVERDLVPTYNTIRYPEEKITPIVRGHNTVYIKPMTISNEPMGTRRHLRSGSDVLVVHHPTPQDLDD